jgi:hypothetical protein
MVTLQNVVASLARSLWTPRYSAVLPNGFIGNIIVYGVRFEGGVVSGSFLREALSSIFTSTAGRSLVSYKSQLGRATRAHLQEDLGRIRKF